MEPRVSVILPTYNRAHLLKRAIRSVVNQTYKDFELIIVNDGSVDSTEEAIKTFDDKRIIYIKQSNRGAAAAVNKGIESTRGKFIAFLDDDDEWLPEKLKIQMEIFEKEPSKTGVVYTGKWRIDITSNKKTYAPYSHILNKEGDIHKELFAYPNFVSPVTAIVRKECLEKVGKFDETLPSGNDRDLWIRISRYYHFKYIPIALANAYLTPGSISRTEKNIIETAKILLNRYKDEYKKFGRKRFAYLLCRIGTSTILEGNIKEGSHFLLKALLAPPWNPIYRLISIILAFKRAFLIKVREGKQKESCSINKI